MVSHYCCDNERRLQTARTQPGVDGRYLNGIDYLEVSSDQKTLIVHLLQNLSSSNRLDQDNVRITDEMEQAIEISSVQGLGRLLTIRLKEVSDRPSYCLRLVESPLKLAQLGILDTTSPPTPAGFDPQLCRIRFAFQAKEISEVDCKTPDPLPEKLAPSPEIDYLAKDYASFRQLILDRLTVTMPAWKERSPADIGIMLVEVLAYAADHLSYYQDAVATEAYLGTARRRISVRRHARLLDYFMHDGCNARTWVVVKVNKPQANPAQFNPKTDGIQLLGPSKAENRPGGTRLLTRINDLPTVLSPTNPKYQELILKALNSDAQIFETLHDITLYEPCNTISFYTWGEEECYLPMGATQITLKDTGGKLQQCLTPGKVLIFEENLNPETGQPQGIDLTHRHAVRLTKVRPGEDPLIFEEVKTEEHENSPKRTQRILEVEWAIEDAIPFQLCISKRINGKLYSDITIARGNVVLVDHGRTRPDNPLLPNNNLEKEKAEASQDPKYLDEGKLNQVSAVNRYRPQLRYGSLTHQRYVPNQTGKWVLFDSDKPARDALGWLAQDLYSNLSAKEYNVYSKLATKEYKAEELAREALDQKRRFIKPSITLKEYNAQEFLWEYQSDLLNSDRFDRHFVVETEEDGRAYLRFGDDALGKRPEVDTYFEVTYRTGNGTVGNIGADAIAHIITDVEGIQSVRNPLPAQGGIDPESLDQVRLYAPQAFRVPQRAVTADDYAKIAERYPDVQRVRATRRWTGSWYTIFLTVDRKGDRPLDKDFKQGLRDFLERFRMAGQDLEIEEPQFVPLKICMTVQVASGYFRNSVKQALMDVFSNRVQPNGLLGFFHPEHLTFGQPIYLSQIIQAAVQIDGVRSVEVTAFQRWGKPPQGEIKAGQITFGPLEIAQLNNDPANPGRGRIEFDMEGGL